MDTTKEMFLDFAKSSKTRQDKVTNLFRYFEKNNLTKTKIYLIEMIGWTNLQIEEEIESWIGFEKSRTIKK